MVDVRRRTEDTGEEVRAQRAGHILGAVHLRWRENLNDDWTFKAPEEIRRRHERAGVTPAHTAITYCQGGVRAAHAAFALLYAGYGDVKMYDASRAERGNDPTLPVESSWYNRRGAGQSVVRLSVATSPIQQPASSLAPSERERQLVPLLRTAIETVSDGVAFLDGQCRLTFANAALHKLLGDGYTVLGRRCCDAFPFLTPEGTPLCTPEQCPCTTVRADQPLRYAARLRTADGRLRDLVLAFIRAGVDGSVVLIVRDLTELQQLDHLRSTFVSVISHELQTPIAIIKGYASTLGRADATWDTETVRRGLGIIEEEADRLNDMVRNLLSISRIEAGALRLEFAPLQLRPLIERVARKMQVRPGRQRRIVVDVPRDLPQVVADKERIEEVLRNLLDNALKYSPPDSIVAVEAWATGTEVVVAVTDEGQGISVEDRERVFEPFERLDSGLARRRPGAGLGLFICRAIVQAHGGRIWIERGPTGGTRVLFSLPREQKAQLPVAMFLPAR